MLYFVGPYVNDKGNRATFTVKSRDAIPATATDRFVTFASNASDAVKRYRKHFGRTGLGRS